MKESKILAVKLMAYIGQMRIKNEDPIIYKINKEIKKTIYFSMITYILKHIQTV